MALQTFTAGQVLTAAQVTALQSNDFNQTVSTKTADYTLVAADKGTRVEMNSGSATTITVNTDLFNAGDTLFIQNRGAGVCTITAGTATVSTSASLALAEFQGGTLYFVSAGVAIFLPSAPAPASAGGLTLIATASPSAVSSQSFNNVFSATYQNYIIKTALSFTVAQGCPMRLRVGGVDTLGTGYQNQYLTAAITTVSAGRGTGAAEFYWGSSNAGDLFYANIEISNPFEAVRTSFIAQGLTQSPIVDLRAGQHTPTTSFDGITFLAPSGTFTGTIRIYGVQN